MTVQFEISDYLYKCLKKRIELGVASELDMLVDKGTVIVQESKTDILDKIRAEIESKYGQYDICEYFENYDYEENDISEYRPIGNITDILQIIDKYRQEK